MSLPLDMLRVGPRGSTPVSLSSIDNGNNGGGNNNDGGFDYSLDKTGNIGKERFNRRIRKALSRKLPDLIGQVPIDGSGDRDIIHVHLPPEKGPIFQRGDNGHKGYASGDGEPGDTIAPGPESGNGRRGGHGGEGPGGYDVDITGEEILEMVCRDWELPDMEDKQAGQMEEDKVIFDDIRKSRISPIDLKRSAIQAIKRTAATKRHDPNYEHGLKIITDEAGNKRHIIEFRDEDLRRITWNVTEKPVTSAVVVAMRDVSGSIGPEEAYAAKVLLSWTVRFLRTKYSKVDIVFGIYHSQAKMGTEDGITEEVFF